MRVFWRVAYHVEYQYELICFFLEFIGMPLLSLGDGFIFQVARRGSLFVVASAPA